MTKKRNKCLNFFKGIACFGVISVHLKFPGILGESALSLFGWTVPYFLMISGYYSYYKDEKVFFQKNSKKINKILKATIISLLFYLIVTFFNELLLKDDLINWIKNLFSLETIFNAIVFNNFDIINAKHLWFLPSLIYCYLVLRWAIKYKKIDYVYWLIPILLATRFILQYFVGDNWHYQQNAFTCALPCFLFGYYYAVHEADFTKINDKLSNNQLRMIIIALIFISWMGVFIKLPINIFEMGIFTAYIFMFIFAKRNPDLYANNFFTIVGEKYSSFIYVIHMLFVLIIRKSFKMFHLNGYFGILYLKPILVAILSLISAILFNIIINKIKRKKQLAKASN